MVVPGLRPWLLWGELSFPARSLSHRCPELLVVFFSPAEARAAPGSAGLRIPGGDISVGGSVHWESLQEAHTWQIFLHKWPSREPQVLFRVFASGFISAFVLRS